MSLLERIAQAQVIGSYASVDLFGGLLLTQEGKEHILAHPYETLRILQGCHERKEDLLHTAGENQYALLQETLQPYVRIPHQFLGGGAAGRAFRFRYAPIVIKFFHRGETGIRQFRAFLGVRDTALRLPRQYFATECLCAAEDLSGMTPYSVFVREHPQERRRLRKHLLHLERTDPCPIDTGDTFFNHPGSSNIRVAGFHPEHEDPRQRYELAAVDIDVARMLGEHT